MIILFLIIIIENKYIIIYNSNERQPMRIHEKGQLFEGIRNIDFKNNQGFNRINIAAQDKNNKLSSNLPNLNMKNQQQGFQIKNDGGKTLKILLNKNLNEFDKDTEMGDEIKINKKGK